jgi:L-ribulose-5-phosphate 3-epimerase
MLLGYNTNGLAFHDPLDAIALLADIGYRSVALTIDHGTLNPYGDRRVFSQQLDAVDRLLARHGMRSVIETGARFLLDPYVKHEPTLVSGTIEQRRRRIELLCHAIDIAERLGSDAVSFWSGVLRDQIDVERALERLGESLRPVLDYADRRHVSLAFEPEPGMFIATLADFERLLQWIDAPHFGLTIDVGHLFCQGELPISVYLQRWHQRLANVHIEDMRAGVHEHLMFGEGQMDFPPIIETLKNVGYQGGLHVELSRHSHEGPTAARRAYEFLQPLLG